MHIHTYYSHKLIYIRMLIGSLSVISTGRIQNMDSDIEGDITFDFVNKYVVCKIFCFMIFITLLCVTN